jgi:hypothetical protein
MEDPTLNRLRELGENGRKRLGERQFDGLIMALDKEKPGQGVQVLQEALATSDPVEALRRQGMEALARQSEPPRNPKDYAGERQAMENAALYDELRSADREKARRR